MAELVDVFAKHAIDGPALLEVCSTCPHMVLMVVCQLDGADLRFMGVVEVGKQRKLIKSIAQLGNAT